VGENGTRLWGNAGEQDINRDGKKRKTYVWVELRKKSWRVWERVQGAGCGQKLRMREGRQVKRHKEVEEPDMSSMAMWTIT